MKTAKTKIGDVFEVQLDSEKKKYFQYISNDMSQLNSSVIRAFKRSYPITHSPNVDEIVNDEVDFYAHTVLRSGLKMSIWKKIGNIQTIGQTDNILFRATYDYGSGAKVVINAKGEKELIFKKEPGEEILTSTDWYVWKIGEDFKDVGKLEGDNRNAYIGIVINANGVLKMLRGEKYPPNYPGY